MKPLFVSIISTAALLLSGCATESIRRVRATDVVHRNKAVQHSEFIGFADGRAFTLVRLIPFFPSSTLSQRIWWCPVSELSASDIASLQSRISRSPNRTARTN